MDEFSSTPYRPYTFATRELRIISSVVFDLKPHQRKALITLCRSQQLPTSSDTILQSKTRPILPILFDNWDELENPDFCTLSTFGEVVQPFIESPLLTGLVIVLCLELPPGYDTEELRKASWNKEMAATQTRRSEGKWNWDILFDNEEYCPTETLVHPDFPFLSPLQYQFRSSLRAFKRKIQGKRVFPHYTRRGVSSETGDWIRNRVLGSRVVKHGTRKTFFRDVDFSDIKSKDVIHYFIRTGVWPRGKVEMRQQWSPNLLVPRTYFAWGGEAISVSSYLRTFFNDLADIFTPTHRYNRVQSDWLQFPANSTPDTSFYFYDLTSFTSWFHEQVPLLEAMSRSFRDVTVDLVWEGLTIREMSVGDMIQDYIRVVNDLPQFYFRDHQLNKGVGDALRYFRHYTAGFLGVPGNLITCTLGHGLAVSATQGERHSLQVPGDDIGALTRSDEHRQDVITAAKSLGFLQNEKVYDGRQASVYLKRGVRIGRAGVSLTPMVIYPIPAAFVHPRHHEEYLQKSAIYRMPSKDRLVARGAQIMTTFIRDLYKISRGNIEDWMVEVILDYLRYLHSKLRLPSEGIFQGQVLASEVEGERYEDVGVKFPIHGDFLRNDPDTIFADRYIEQMYIRDVSGLEVRWSVEAGLHAGEEFIIRNGRKWSFLRDMGYIIDLQKVGGDKVLLIGDEAKRAYLNSGKPPYSKVRVVEDVDIHQLVSIGFSADDMGLASYVFDEGAISHSRVDRDFRHPLKYRDWDRPTPYGVEVDFYGDGTPTTLMSLGNDSMDLLDLY